MNAGRNRGSDCSRDTESCRPARRSGSGRKVVFCRLYRFGHLPVNRAVMVISRTLELPAKTAHLRTMVYNSLQRPIFGGDISCTSRTFCATSTYGSRCSCTRPASSATKLASSVHVPGREVAKTVLVKAGERFVLAVLPATARIDLDRLGRALGINSSQLRLASSDEILQTIGDCEPGVIPPFGRLYGLETIMDDSLAENLDDRLRRQYPAPGNADAVAAITRPWKNPCGRCSANRSSRQWRSRLSAEGRKAARPSGTDL